MNKTPIVYLESHFHLNGDRIIVSTSKMYETDLQFITKAVNVVTNEVLSETQCDTKEQHEKMCQWVSSLK